MNKRGVGILLKHSFSIAVLEETADPGENFLLLKLSYKGSTFIAGSIYGPNSTDREFFTSLEAGIVSLGQLPIILGGDWNCIWSKAANTVNIDVLNMVTLPNTTNSNKLREMCENLDLTEAFRITSPGRREYTYCPRAVGKPNKSRLDFFIVSQGLSPFISKCQISRSLQNKLFDHKAIFF
jgi:exonuclease III